MSDAMVQKWIEASFAVRGVEWARDCLASAAREVSDALREGGTAFVRLEPGDATRYDVLVASCRPWTATVGFGSDAVVALPQLTQRSAHWVARPTWPDDVLAMGLCENAHTAVVLACLLTSTAELLLGQQ